MQPILVVQHEADDPPARLGEWLVSAGATLDVRRAYNGDPIPDSLEDHGGLLVLGGAPGAYDDQIAPWLPQTRALLATAVRAEVPTLGVCLGAQLLAAATGGRVERGAEGPELGAGLIAKRAATATDPLFGPMPITPDVIQWHYDAITALPPSAILLASSPVYENQAFRLGRLAWGIQGHIETTPEIVRGWAATDPGVQEYDLTRLLERSDAAHADIEEVWAPFAARFVDVVRDPESVRPRRGPVVATAAPVSDPAAIRAALAAEMQGSRAPLTFGRPPGIDDQ
jgi:GMP synthase (glutamine-hydrolysing)